MISYGEYSVYYNIIIYRGVYGDIYKCVKQGLNEELYAQEIIKVQTQLNDNEWNNYLMILNDIKNNTHINILHIYQIIEMNDRILIITEQYTQKLQEYLDQRQMLPLDDLEIKEFIHQIVDGYLHLLNNQIVQGNLNFYNIVVKKKEQCITFKITNFINSRYSITQKFDNNYSDGLFQRAPETKQNIINDKSDIYSFGIILHQICYKGRLNLQLTSKIDQFWQDLKDNRIQLFPNNDQYDEILKSIIQNTIVYDPTKRLDWIQLKEQEYSNIDIFYFPSSNINNKEKYIISSKCIGQGSQAQVFLAINTYTQTQVVAKQFDRYEFFISREIDLFKILKDKKHPNVVELYDLYTKNSNTYLIMEKCDINLSDYMNKIDNDEKIIDFLKQIINGYQFLIQNKILHRDLKPKNIMIKLIANTKPIYKIIDFGVSKHLKQNFTQSNAGTPKYKAPEIYNGQEHNYQCDIYSLGLILYEIVFKSKGMQITNYEELLLFQSQLKNNTFKCPHYNNILITNLIERMIVYDQKKRINWNNILNHSLFQPQQFHIIYYKIYLIVKQIFFDLLDINQTINLEFIKSMKSILLVFMQAILLMIYNFCSKGYVKVQNQTYQCEKGYNGQEWLEQVNLAEEVNEIQPYDEKQFGDMNQLLFYYNQFSQIYLQNNQLLNQILKSDQKLRIQQFFTITKQVDLFSQNSMQRFQ